MERRAFLELLATTPLASAVRLDGAEQPAAPAPSYKVVTRYAPAPLPGMPGPFPGRVVRARSARLPESASVAVDPLLVREMMERGMRSLTGESTTLAAWRRFFEPQDVVAIKVNAGGRPYCVIVARDRGRDRAPADGGRAQARRRSCSTSASSASSPR